MRRPVDRRQRHPLLYGKIEQGSRSRLTKRGAFTEWITPKAYDCGPAAVSYSLITVDHIADVPGCVERTCLFLAERRVRELDAGLPLCPLMPLYGALAGVIPDMRRAWRPWLRRPGVPPAIVDPRCCNVPGRRARGSNWRPGRRVSDADDTYARHADAAVRGRSGHLSNVH